MINGSWGQLMLHSLIGTLYFTSAIQVVTIHYDN